MRRVLALALVLLLPSALAQLPTQPQGCGPIAVVATSPASAVREGETATFTVSVRNGGQRAVDAVVAADLSTSGWSFTTGGSQNVSVAPGETKTVSFGVSPGPEAREDATVNVATTGSCPPPGGLPCPGTTCTTQGEPQTVVVAYEAASGLRIPGLDGLDIPLPFLLAGILLVVAAVLIPLLLRKRSPARATATCPEPMKPVRPGRGASFPIELRNPSETARKVQLEVGPVPEGWSAFLPLPEIQLAPRETRSLWLMVRAPMEARQGDTADVEVTARDEGRPERPSVVKVRAEVEPDAPEPATP